MATKRTKHGGRKKGTPNKVTSSAKEAFEFAFGELGGSKGLADWARGHKDEFYRLYSRLIPRPVTLGTGEGDEDGGLTIKVVHFAGSKP